MKLEVTDSRFAMWRAAIALAYADGKLSPKEVELLHKNAQLRAFSEGQKKIFENDMANGVKLDDVFGQITNSRDRMHLINFAGRLFLADGDFSIVEKRLLEDISQKHQKMLKETIKQANEQPQASLAAPGVMKPRNTGYTEPYNLNNLLTDLLD